MVPPASGRVSRARTYSGTKTAAEPSFAYGALTLFRRPFHAVLLDARFVHRNQRSESLECFAPQPPDGNASPLIHAPGFGLDARSLAATSAISVDFSSSAYLDVSVRRVVLRTLMDLGCGYPGMTLGGFPHSETSGCKRVCAPHRRLSQLAASFIDCLCQGIHRAPVISSLPNALVIREVRDTVSAHDLFMIDIPCLRSFVTDTSATLSDG